MVFSRNQGNTVNLHIEFRRLSNSVLVVAEIYRQGRKSIVEKLFPSLTDAMDCRKSLSERFFGVLTNST
jgi:hypothetical protein